MLDLYALLLYTMYVDLNPIRAGIAATSATSRHTFAFHRIQARQSKEKWDAAAWLVPIDEAGEPPDGRQSMTQHAQRQGRSWYRGMNSSLRQTPPLQVA